VRLSKHRLEIIDPEAFIATAGIENGIPEAIQRVGRQAFEQPPSFTLQEKLASSLPAGWIPIQNDRAVPHPASASHPTAPTEFHRFSQLVQRTSQVLLLSFWALAGLEENHQPQIDLLLRAKERKHDETVSFTGN
jgi:hypothetical protein